MQTRANGQPALAVCSRDADGGRWRAGGLLVLTLNGEQVSGLTRFETTTMRPFGLPGILPTIDQTSEHATGRGTVPEQEPDHDQRPDSVVWEVISSPLIPGAPGTNGASAVHGQVKTT